MHHVIKLTDLSYLRLKKMEERGQLALAWSRPHLFAKMAFWEVDAMALLIAEALRPRFGRKIAGQIVRCWWHIWLQCVAKSEEEREPPPVYFAVLQFELPNGKTAHLCAVAEGNVDAALLERARSYSDGEVMLTTVDVTRLIGFMRKQAAKHNIDLSGAFLPALDHHETQELIKRSSDKWDDAMNEARARRDGERCRKFAETHIGERLQ